MNVRGPVASAILAMTLAIPAPAWSATLRYALIIGNNDASATAPNLPPLKHAETGAFELREKLVEYSGFDPSPDQTVVVTAPTKANVDEAVERLATRIRDDRLVFSDVDVLFVFFFTGHGRRGRLLLREGALSGGDVDEIFRMMAADVTVGVFDACYSGSVDPTGLDQMGAESAPAAFMEKLADLPAEGDIVFVSSGPEQVSYEDRRLGGVFGHFFGEALQNARATGPGITLDSIWEYTKSRTEKHIVSRGRIQTPERRTRMKESGLLFFSYPTGRTESLVLGDRVEGRYILPLMGRSN